MMQQRLKAKLMVARWGSEAVPGAEQREQHCKEMRLKAEPLVAGAAGKEAAGRGAGSVQSRGGMVWAWERAEMKAAAQPPPR